MFKYFSLIFLSPFIIFSHVSFYSSIRPIIYCLVYSFFTFDNFPFSDFVIFSNCFFISALQNSRYFPCCSVNISVIENPPTSLYKCDSCYRLGMPAVLILYQLFPSSYLSLILLLMPGSVACSFLSFSHSFTDACHCCQHLSKVFNYILAFFMIFHLFLDLLFTVFVSLVYPGVQSLHLTSTLSYPS